MTADQWTHHDPAVRELIRRAQADVLRETAAEAERVQHISATSLSAVSRDDLDWLTRHPLRSVHHHYRPCMTVGAWLANLADQIEVTR